MGVLLLSLAVGTGCSSFKGLSLDRPDCEHATIPPRPLLAGDLGDIQFIVAERYVDLGEIDDERGTHRYRNMGYDLDNTCTGQGTASSCVEPPWATDDHTDGPGGRDNAVGASMHRILELNSGSSTEFVNSSIEAGYLAMVMRVSGYNGMTVDGQVDVAYFAATLNLLQPEPIPVWNGEDVWHAGEAWVVPIVQPDGTQLYPGDLPARYHDPGAYVTDGVLVSELDHLLASFGVYHLSHVVMTARVISDNGKWELQDGTFAARQGVDELVANLQYVHDPETGRYMCKNEPSYLTYKKRACARTDIRYSEPIDDPSLPCDGVSWGWKFETRPVKLEGTAPIAVSPPCEGEFSPADDSCNTL
jgi:hypothetical protein